MPVYNVITELGSTTEEQRRQIAKGLTAIHSEETGAPEPLIHVIFTGYPAGMAYTSNRPGKPTIVQASIRGGRPESVRQAMFARINKLIPDVLGIQDHDLLVALFDFPPHFATEAGLTLPLTNPEAEAQWEAAFYAKYPKAA